MESSDFAHVLRNDSLHTGTDHRSYSYRTSAVLPEREVEPKAAANAYDLLDPTGFLNMAQGHGHSSSRVADRGRDTIRRGDRSKAIATAAMDLFQ